MASYAYDAVLFDLLSALLDSWSLWAEVAGGTSTGRRWREEYLKRTYQTGAYRPYVDIVAEAAEAEGVGSDVVDALIAGWDGIRPWPEARAVAAGVAGMVPIGV